MSSRARASLVCSCTAARSSNADMYVGVFNLGYGRPWTWAPTLRAQRTPFFRVTGDIGNAWQDPPGKRLPTMGLLATVDAIQAMCEGREAEAGTGRPIATSTERPRSGNHRIFPTRPSAARRVVRASCPLVYLGFST